MLAGRPLRAVPVMSVARKPLGRIAPHRTSNCSQTDEKTVHPSSSCELQRAGRSHVDAHGTAASVLQASARRRSAERGLRRALVACLKIQSAARCVPPRLNLRQTRNAANTVARAFRGHRVRRGLVSRSASLWRRLRDATRANRPVAIAYANANGHEAVSPLERGDYDAWSPQSASSLSSSPSTLLVACANGHEAAVRLLLERGLDAAHANEDGWSPLLVASANGHEVITRLLLERGADVSRANRNGRSPLLAASRNGHEAVGRLLLKFGADVAQADKFGWSPLLAASRNGHEAVVRLLLERGAGQVRVGPRAVRRRRRRRLRLLAWRALPPGTR